MNFIKALVCSLTLLELTLLGTSLGACRAAERDTESDAEQPTARRVGRPAGPRQHAAPQKEVLTLADIDRNPGRQSTFGCLFVF